ncbi:hypothetical protein [Streptomyces sp. NPDC051214]|uniref:hypothetical protein n=1 Tax=Streptomyces sp. NPDC051214 TaxID=3155282 RepID=UPI003426390A
MKRTTTIDKNATAPTGHLPFAVQAALRTSEAAALLADADTARQHETSPVLLREAELNRGEFGVWGHEGGRIVAAYDPTQISREDAETRLRAQMNAKGISVSEFLAEPAVCPIWSGVCTVAEPGHYDHCNHGHQAVNKSGGQLLDVGFAALSNDSNPAPVIYIGSEDYAPGEFHAASASVRRLMDTGDDMAETTMLRQGNGTTALARIDQKVQDETTRLVALVAHRRQVADQLHPARTPLDDPEDKQTAHAAFALAVDAIDIAMAESPDKAVMLLALRAMVNLYAEDIETALETVAAEYDDCPRCRNKMDLPGKSRATPDREIKICGPCCSDEAMREAAGRPWPAVAEWPVTRQARA